MVIIMVRLWYGCGYGYGYGYGYTGKTQATRIFLAVRCEASLEAKFCSSSAVQETRVFEHVIESPEWSGKDSST